MAEAFDLILREYSGFTDDSILDLTLDRFRQMIAVIIQRKRYEMRAKMEWDLQVTEVAARSLGGLIAGLSQNKKQYAGMRKIVEGFHFADMLKTPEEVTAAKEARMPNTANVMQSLGVGGSGLAGVK